jgi:hypothetical protein
MIAQEDSELFHWLLNAAGRGIRPPAGDFLKHLAEAALRADAENYFVLRPILVEMAVKYPKYR